MTKLPDLANELTAVEDDAWLYTYSLANPTTPDRRMKQSTLRAASKEETLTNKTIGAPATTKPVYASLLQLVGAKITHLYRTAGNLTISALAAGAEEDLTIAVTGAAVGDLVVVSPTAAPEAGVGFMLAWVSATGTVTVRVGNLSGSSLTGGNQAVVVLVIRAAAADV